MGRPIVNTGRVFWTGQHWINYLRVPGAEEDSGRVSVWHTHYCGAGEGTVAYVDIPGDPGLRAVCTDNRDLAAFVDSWVRDLPGPYQIDVVIDAAIRREGSIDAAPAWVIETGGATVVATWFNLEPPVIMEAPAPTVKPDRDVYSHLFFTDEATIRIDDRSVEGEPYLRDIWQQSIGGERSSCVVALSETFIEVPS
ncbi:MAG: hypothetical protein VX293_06050 [Candidatus Latescibacterota bacterium]|nr:hypothetical protein [Candidatus Latescibacterota bacterium]